MKKIFKSEWNKSYDHFDNHIFYPKEEVVKFLNRFVRKKISDNLFKDILIKEKGNITGLDYGCGIGRMTMLMKEFNIDSYGLDISESAIKKARNLFPDMKEKFKVTDGENIPFPNQDFDIVICESVIYSMGFKIAKKVVSEFDRITKISLY